MNQATINALAGNRRKHFLEGLSPGAGPALAKLLQQLGIMGLVARCQQLPPHRVQTGITARAVVDRQCHGHHVERASGNRRSGGTICRHKKAPCRTTVTMLIAVARCRRILMHVPPGAILRNMVCSWQPSVLRHERMMVRAGLVLPHLARPLWC